MDQALVDKLKAAGMPVDPVALGIRIPAQLARGPIVLEHGGRALEVELRPLTELFTGSAPAPGFGRNPPEAYLPFLATIESTAAVACVRRGRPERDEELERLYRQLRRRPDGTDANPMFYWLQCAARLYLSLRPTSRAEFEAVLNRLSLSGRTFHTHVGSTNYFEHALAPFVEGALR